MELAALLLAGLSLFFTGVSGVRSKLQQLSSRKCRQALGRVVNRPVAAGLLGMGFGALTQSASAVSFLLSGMVATGLIPLRRALPIVAASNVGTTLLVFLATFDMNLAVLFLIGTTGLMINFRIGPRHEALWGALFSIGLLFFGLGLMKQAFGPLPGYEGFRALAAFLREWSWAPFILGAALRMVIQSSSTIGVIAIALQSSGLFTEFQAIMLMCGIGPGVALSVFFLSGTLEGPPRQIVLYQGIINLISGSLMGALFLAAHFEKITILPEQLDLSPDSTNGHVAAAFFLNMLGCFLVGLLILPWIEPWLKRLAPASLEQNLSRPAYIYDEALSVPESAVELADKEQLRLYGLVLKSLDTIRDEAGKKNPGDDAALRSASRALQREIADFLRELINQDVTSEVASTILSLERRQEHLGALLETVHKFVDIGKGGQFSGELSALLDRLTESLHLMLTMAQDAWLSGDPTDFEYLLKLTEDRSDMMERIRRTYQAAGKEGSLDQSSALFYATTLFERTAWLLRQTALSLQNRSEPAAA